MEDPKRSWSFVPQSIQIAGGNLMTITGWFVILTITQVENEDGHGSEPYMSVDYLTDFKNPLTMQIPDWLIKDKPIDEVSANDVVEAMKAVFSLDFTGIPKAPIPVPMHRIPPSKRDKVREMMEKNR